MILLPTVCTKIESVCFATSFAKSFTESGAVSNTDILINSLASNASDNCFIKLEEIPDLPIWKIGSIVFASPLKYAP